MNKGIHVNKDWGRPEKVKARQVSVFDSYRRLTGRQSIQSDRQYWSLCGLHQNEMCEFPQLLKSGIIQSPEQYHGVDCREDVITHNRSLYPKVHWHHDDFIDAMENAPDFNPGIVNFDVTSMVEKTCQMTAQILYMLIGLEITDVFMVVNFLLNNPRRRVTLYNHPNDFFELVNASPLCQEVFSEALDLGWRISPESYIYDGADSRAQTYLQTIHFIR